VADSQRQSYDTPFTFESKNEVRRWHILRICVAIPFVVALLLLNDIVRSYNGEGESFLAPSWAPLLMGGIALGLAYLHISDIQRGLRQFKVVSVDAAGLSINRHKLWFILMMLILFTPWSLSDFLAYYVLLAVAVIVHLIGVFIVIESPAEHFRRKMDLDRRVKVIVRKPGQPTSHM